MRCSVTNSFCLISKIEWDQIKKPKHRTCYFNSSKYTRIRDKLSGFYYVYSSSQARCFVFFFQKCNNSLHFLSSKLSTQSSCWTLASIFHPVGHVQIRMMVVLFFCHLVHYKSECFKLSSRLKRVAKWKVVHKEKQMSSGKDSFCF